MHPNSKLAPSQGHLFVQVFQIHNILWCQISTSIYLLLLMHGYFSIGACDLCLYSCFVTFKTCLECMLSALDILKSMLLLLLTCMSTCHWSFRYSIQEEYLTIRSDAQYISFPLSTDILACQVSNGQFCHINSPLYTADTSSSCSYALFLQNKDRIKKFCILSGVNETIDEAININDNFWSISTLQDNKSITCLQFSYSIKLHFPYDIIYLPDGCEANAITVVLPSNNKLNVEPRIETAKYKLSFNRSHLK